MSTTDHTSEDNTMVPAYKGFNRDLTCRGFQYAEGETYRTGRAELCVTGFHACPMPLDTLRYYPPRTSVYHVVEVDADAHRGDDKVVSKRIKIGGRMSLAGLIEAHLSLAFKRADEAEGTDVSTAAASGARSTAATSGRWSTAATSGARSTAATSGARSTAATSGYESAAKVEGEHSIAVAGGHQCRAMGSLGCWLVLAERDDDGAITHLEAVQVDGERIKPDLAYMLRDGQVVEA